MPVVMTWTSELMQPVHGEVGVAAAGALVSGLGNLGSVMVTYALYTGWEEDGAREGRKKYMGSNLVMVGILGVSVVASLGLWGALKIWGGGKGEVVRDGAARREERKKGAVGGK